MPIPIVQGFGSIPVGRYYLGPGDILGAPRAFWGPWAYKNSVIGNTVCRIQRASDSAQQDFATTFPSGLVDIAAITTFLAATTGTGIKYYEQVGLGSTYDLVNGITGVAAAPSFITADSVGTPCLRAVAASTQSLRTVQTTENLSMPFSFVSVGLNALSGTPNSGYFGKVGPIADERLGGSIFTAGDWYGYAGAVISKAVTANVLHDLVAVFNGASSHLYVDAVDTAGSIGTNVGIGQYILFALGLAAGPSNFWSGDSKEVGVWTSALTQTDATNYRANARARMGY